MKCLVLAAMLVASVAACRSDSAHGGPDAPVDVPDGIGCTPTTPRTMMPDTFVGPTGLQDRLGTLIDSAQHSLDVQMYLFTVKPLADKIVAAQQRGVTVRVILDPDEAGNTNVEPTFTSASIQWKNASTVYQYSHAKYLIIDRATAVIMSMNFNLDAMNNERNYGMVDKDPEDVADLQLVFDQDWALANGQTPAAPNLDCTRLIISPTNAQQRIYTHIQSSQHTLDIESLYITDASLRSAVVAAANRGVAVRVILEDPSDQASNTDATTTFKGAGIPVKYADTQFYLHAKLIISDGIAFVGSENLSPTALQHNREVGALVFEPAAVQPIQAQFDADWNITTPAP